MKVLICGDRNWVAEKPIAAIMEELQWSYKSDLIIIHGAARGVDSLAGKFARAFGVKVIECPANWTRYGAAAGPIRNREMLKHKPDMVLAFHNDLDNSKGTRDMVLISLEAGVRDVLIIRYDENGLSESLITPRRC